jgi:hypothetical protein
MQNKMQTRDRIDSDEFPISMFIKADSSTNKNISFNESSEILDLSSNSNQKIKKVTESEYKNLRDSILHSSENKFKLLLTKSCRTAPSRFIRKSKFISNKQFENGNITNCTAISKSETSLSNSNFRIDLKTDLIGQPNHVAVKKIHKKKLVPNKYLRKIRNLRNFWNLTSNYFPRLFRLYEYDNNTNKAILELIDYSMKETVENEVETSDRPSWKSELLD